MHITGQKEIESLPELSFIVLQVSLKLELCEASMVW